jgi:putative ABC transport system substrate-binding protein
MRPTRLTALAALALALLAAPLAVDAQQAGKVYRIGVLMTDTPQSKWRDVNRGFLEKLRELGYVEGSNVAFEVRSAEGNHERLPSLAVELVRLNVDLILAGVTPSARAAKAATSTIPIVITHVGDPVGSGLVASLARPGGNVTGLTNINPELNAKRLELLRELTPGLSRIAALWNANPASAGPLNWRHMQAAGPAMGVTLQSVAVQDQRELQGAFDTMTRARTQAVVVLSDSMFWEHRTRIVGLAAQHRLAAMYESRDFVDAGGLVSYGANYDWAHGAAIYVDRIFRGAKPADLPIQQPTKFELAINLKTAKALGLTIPPSVLARADEVIQ